MNFNNRFPSYDMNKPTLPYDNLWNNRSNSKISDLESSGIHLSTTDTSLISEKFPTITQEITTTAEVTRNGQLGVTDKLLTTLIPNTTIMGSNLENLTLNSNDSYLSSNIQSSTRAPSFLITNLPNATTWFTTTSIHNKHSSNSTSNVTYDLNKENSNFGLLTDDEDISPLLPTQEPHFIKPPSNNRQEQPQTGPAWMQESKFSWQVTI